MSDPNFWQGKRVLITGHTGFKGSWLALWLQTLGAQVVGYALEAPTQTSMFELAAVAEGMTSILGDIRDLTHLQQVTSDFRPEIVMHLAAQPLVRKSYQLPVETYSTNVMGTVHLLEAIRQVGGVRAVVCVTSDKCYHNRNWVWSYRENELLGGYDPYSSSKACAELVTSAYRSSFFSSSDAATPPTAIATARVGNVIGGGDWSEDRLVPDALHCLMQNKPLFVRNPHATRPWQHVLEPLNGYLMLTERLYADGKTFSEAWNFGSSDIHPKSVVWMVEQLISLWGSDIAWELDKNSHPHEESYLKVDCSKAHNKLGWKQKLDVKTTLSWIVDWTKAFKTGAQMRRYTQEQIQNFMTLPNYDSNA
jgi:CDP-glucose 4,6-dehydratase